MAKHESGTRTLHDAGEPTTLSQRMWSGQADLIRAAAAKVGKSAPEWSTDVQVAAACETLGLPIPLFPAMNRRAPSTPPEAPGAGPGRLVEIEQELRRLLAEARKELSTPPVSAPRRVANMTRQ